MTVLLRTRFTFTPGAIGAHLSLLQLYWRPGTLGGSTADATDCLARVRAMLLAAQATINTLCLYTPITAVDAIEDTTGHIVGSFTGAAPANVTGTATGDPMPAQTAYVLKGTTNLVVGPRLLKGRTFFGVPSETGNAPAGTPLTSNVTTLNAAFNGMLTGGATLSFPVIWHRPGGASAPVGTNGPVINYQCQASYWGSQRGRRF